MSAATMVWLVNWVLPVAGALGLWLTSSKGRWLYRIARRIYSSMKKENQIRLAIPFAYCLQCPDLVTRRLGYALGLITQPLWLWFTYQYLPETWGPFATSCLYTLAWGRGIIRR